MKRASGIRPLMASSRFGSAAVASASLVRGGASRLLIGGSPGSALRQIRGFHRLPQLEYIERPASLGACFSEEAFVQHLKKHHLPHIQAVNKLIEGTDLETLSLEQLVVKASKDKNKASLFNHAAEAWNHNFFLQCMIPVFNQPSQELINRLTLHFGGLDQFKSKFEQFATAHFGSGWTWLVDRDGHLEIVNTTNAGTVITDLRCSPLLVVDVWEHAYYLDYREDRKEYIRNWWNVVNWTFVEEQLKDASGRSSLQSSLKEYPQSI